MTDIKDRIAGVLVGQAAGDALGAGYEFRATPDYADIDMIGGGLADWEPGEWTDDTQQAIIVAQRLPKDGVPGVANGLVRWFAGGPADVGSTTIRALYRAKGMEDLKRNAAEAAQHLEMTNGSLMRTGPVALPFLGDRDAIVVEARAVSRLTHAGSKALDATVLWSLAIDVAVRTGKLDVEAGLEFIPEQRRDYWANIISAAGHGSLDPEALAANGPVQFAFAAALHAVWQAYWEPDPTLAMTMGLRTAVAIGGDTDTVAAIAGALLGALYGASSVPQEWREQLHGWTPDGTFSGSQLEALALEAAEPSGVLA